MEIQEERKKLLKLDISISNPHIIMPKNKSSWYVSNYCTIVTIAPIHGVGLRFRDVLVANLGNITLSNEFIRHESTGEATVDQLLLEIREMRLESGVMSEVAFADKAKPSVKCVCFIGAPTID